MASWTDIKANWSAGWKELHRRAMGQLGRAIERDPGSFRPHVEATLADVRASSAHLQRIQAMLPRIQDPQHSARVARAFAVMMQRYHTLAAGLYADAEQSNNQRDSAQPSEVSGVIVPLLVIGGIVFGVAAIAWAVASREHAKNLREQTALADHELAARVEASKEGRTLQDTTLPEQPTSAPLLNTSAAGATGSKVGLMLLGGLAIAAAVLAAPTLLKR